MLRWRILHVKFILFRQEAAHHFDAARRAELLLLNFGRKRVAASESSAIVVWRSLWYQDNLFVLSKHISIVACLALFVKNPYCIA